MENKIRVVIKKVGRKPFVEYIENTLSAFQSIVGGYIECLRYNNVVLVCDEEGKLKGKQGNFFVQNDMICGDVIFTKSNSEGDFVSLSDKDIDSVVGRWRK